MRPLLRGTLLLLSPALSAAFLAQGPSAWIVVMHAAGAVALFLLDGTLGVQRNVVAVERAVDRRICVGARETVTLTVENRSSRRLRLLLRDGVPEALRPDRFHGSVDVAARARGRTSYTIAPDRRGVFPFASTWVQVPGLLGLCARTLQVSVPDQVAVIPDIRPLRIYDLQATRAVLASQGIRRQRQAGEGGEVARLKEYEPGDDPRLIDWKATARRNLPISREMEAERNRHVVFLVDAGRWMGQPVDNLLKLDHALNAVLMASHVADRSGDLTSVQVFSDRVLVFRPPARGRRHQIALLEQLHRVPAEAVEPDFDLAFRFHSSRVRKRALAILFSDFSDPVTAEALQRSLPVIQRRHLLLCVHILDPAVESLVGLRTDRYLDLSRRAVAENLRHERTLVLERLAAGGAHVLEARADRLTGDLVNRYLDIKGRGLL